MSSFQVKNFIRLRQIFKNKGWSENPQDDHAFVSLTLLLNNLSEKEQALILELTEQYLWIENGKYIPLLRDMLSEEICSNDLGAFENVYFFPVIKPRDQSRTKSGNLLIYYVQTVRAMLKGPVKNKNIITLENFSDVEESGFKLGQNDVLVLVDDFLGTGQTLKSTLEILFENSSINSKNTRILAFTAMMPSIQLMDSFLLKYYVSNVVKKGITDAYSGSDAEDKRQIMRRIENMSEAPRSYKMGFKKSEALVTMARTPNNTFSIFWAKHVKGDEVFDAPFPRF